ncbi:sn-glycerol-3-phosphate ABC transporter ATP-binding protein UgpC [uncultured Pleomorphomonas sp.]|nr:sn-glycerol-3-phosphate ABC transporter ATP-binding protein UgpC [uncultured Pleomorphomonas sp.]
MGSVTLNNVTKTFGQLSVIHDVSLQIEEGEFCVLVGPSGSGKSTLLRIIAGLEAVSSGQVTIGGRDVTTLPPKHRDIAMVFQTYALYPQMTVRENMGFALKLAGVPKPEIARKVAETAEMLELGALLDRLPKELSGGQRQRVSMGRAIVRNPSVFLFDEPLSNLDAKLRSQVRGEIADLHRRLSTTSVYVTHDQIEAMTLGQKIVVLKDGRVEQAGAPLELYEKPVNTFVAGFLGTPSINLLRTKAQVSEEGKFAVFENGAKVRLDPAYEVGNGQDLVYGIRPEHVRLSGGAEAGGIPARVHSVENTGSDMVVFSDAGPLRITAAFKEQRNIAPGEAITLTPDLAKAHIFDAATSKRIPALS